MYLKYGNYIHPLGEPAVTINRETVRSSTGQAFAIRNTWQVTGLVVAQDGLPATIQRRVAELEAAYTQDYQDAVILMPDRTTPTNHVLTNSTAIGGVRVTQPPSFPDGGGAQGVTLRTFQVTLEAIVAASAGQVILAFEEMLSFSGGGPRYGHLETLTGIPVKQQLRQATVYRAVQTGRALGQYAYPVVPLPIWPAALMQNPDVQRRSPRRIGNGYFEYEVSWAYRFESSGRLSGSAHAWTA